MKRVRSTILHSVTVATVLASAFATHASAQERRDEWREEHRDRDRDDDHDRDRDRDRRWRRDHARRVVVDRDRDLDRYRERYAHRRGWRTYGVYYGLPPGLAANPSISFLADSGTLVGSYEQHGHVVYLYVYDDDIGQRHQIEVRDDGRVMSDAILPNVPGFGY